MNRSSLLLLRGILALVVGLVAMFWPALSLALLVALFAVYAFVDGVANLALGTRLTPAHGRSWGRIALGIVGIAAGALAFMWPGMTALVLVTWIGVWALIAGVLEIVTAIALRREIEGEWRLALAGTLSILFGLFLLAFPLRGAIGLGFALGAYAAAMGVVLIVLAIRMRQHRPAAA